MTPLYCKQGHSNASNSRFCHLCGELLQSGESSIAIAGHLLGWRYQVLSELGQGGFGRTYLAEDTHRFNERCVLKEFAPQVQGEQALQKAEELFAREAGTLYQLQHPQIPRFRELFRAEWQGRDRLFLVQDYVEGETFYELLKNRLQQGYVFSEAEVTQLILQLLPVLDYIHSLGVIHRDISPDNLIRRSLDGLPVLIDYGGVKQVAAKVMPIEAGKTIPSSQPETVTRLGKMGYAPPEQLELGEVNPHSDFYALAVTALVLLTGKEPPDLFSRNGTLDRYQWRKEISLNPKLLTILSQMLDPSPAKRYQSAQAILQAFGATKLKAPDTNKTHESAHSVPAIPVFHPDAATIAVAPQRITQTTKSTPPRVKPPGRGIGRTLLSVVFLSGLIAGGWWAGVNWLGPALRSQLPEIVKPSNDKDQPPTQPTETDPQGPDLSKAEQDRKQKIDSRRQQLSIDNGFFNQLVNAEFYRQHPQLDGRKLSLDPTDEALREDWDNLALDTLNRLAALNADARSRLGKYTEADLLDRQTIASQLNLSSRAINDLADATFLHLFPEHPLNENLLNQPIGQVWQAIAADQIQALRSGKLLEKIEFSPNNFSHRVSGTLQPGEGKAYTANLSVNQTLRLQLQAPNQSVRLSLYTPNSKAPALLEDSRETSWSGKLTEPGFYEITIVSDTEKPIDYAIDLAAADEVTTP